MLPPNLFGSKFTFASRNKLENAGYLLKSFWFICFEPKQLRKILKQGISIPGRYLWRGHWFQFQLQEMEHIWNQEMSLMVSITSGEREGGGRRDEESNFPEKATIYFKKNIQTKILFRMFSLVAMNITHVALAGQLLEMRRGFPGQLVFPISLIFWQPQRDEAASPCSFQAHRRKEKLPMASCPIKATQYTPSVAKL